MPTIVCEIGCNHRGEIETAIEMIKVAATYCDVDVIKFQKRTNRELLSPEEYDRPHPVPENAYGATYGEHRELLEFDVEQHKILKQVCESHGKIYSTSVWDVTSAKEIANLNPELIKIPSAINTNQQVLDYLFRHYGGEIHISLGMTTKDEERAIIEQAKSHDRAKDLVLYHCTSGYPVELDELYLLEIPRLIEEYANTVKTVGFSGHHKGIASDVVAVTLGATHVERHFTLDRTWKGTDHAASLEPDGLRRLVRDARNVGLALQRKPKDIVDIEVAQREKLKKVVSL